MSSLLDSITNLRSRAAPRTTNDNSKGNRKRKKPVPGEETFLRLIEEAEYEINHDPYRGMLASADAEPSPWKCCQFGCTDDPNNDNDDEEDEVQDYCESVVKSTCSCSCPALIAWTTEAHQKKNRSKKRRRSDEVVFGQRPEDPKFKCPCDYNPFCLATLGGAMNEILLNRMKQIAASESGRDSSQSREGSIGDAEDDDEVVVVEKDSTDSIKGWELDPTKENSIYSLQTKEWLKNVRRSTMVDIEPIRSFLSETLQELTSVISIEGCLKRIQEMNDALVFVNPLLEEGDKSATSTEANMRLSIPPGIENLGATCYLNTQLQCLAQNPVFLDGIFSWRAVQKDDRMSSVLSLFQQLLVNMKAGHRCSLNTLEFSNALGLDHYEQQDPNEFSRLLFERMHESFQASSGAAAVPNEDGRKLAELLPHLFQGMTTYETTCLTCQSKSRTNEEFMDLNLPIVQPSDNSPRKAGQQSILEAFKAVSDTDVQFCLDKYCREEILDGDNQYFCSKCNCKRDAKREFNFQKLPPVLNVQLSRYVFDMKKLMKKKLSDKVLLPLELAVEAKSKERKAGLIKHRYVLCAVMKHQGSSAYSGHYVAEAMDWHTGQWFEFNDEKVTFLKDGPSCSYDPSAPASNEKDTTTTPSNNRKKGKSASLSGSQDAYNMYYVEESFLAQSLLDRLRKVGGKTDAFRATRGGDHEQLALLDRLAISRSDYYSDLAIMCIEDGKAASRLDQRREGIQKSMFTDILALKDDRPPVWVDARMLVRFMSCKDRLDEVLAGKDGNSLLGHRGYLCVHKSPGLHPRRARKGKLLPRSVYDAFVEILSAERRSLSGKESSVELNDCVITPTANLRCQECCSEYCRELSFKVESLRTLKYLYDALDSKEPDFPVEMKPDESLENDEDSHAYVVSRKFITSMRNMVARLMKKANGAESSGRVDGENGLANGLEGFAEGIDAFDPKSFTFDASAENSNDEDTLDARINSNITCEHGNCIATSKRSTRFVSYCEWSALKSIFPNAIEHKIRRRKPDNLEFGDDLLGCAQCESDGQVTDYLRTRLSDLAQHCSGPRSIRALSPTDFLERELAACSPSQYRIVHKADFVAWQRFLSIFKRKDGQKKISEGPEDQLSNLLRSHVPKDLQLQFKCNKEASQSDQSRVDLLSKTIRPVVCNKHRRPVRSAIFRNNEAFAKTTSPSLLSDYVHILDETAYKDFVRYFAAIAVGLYPDYEKPLSAQMESSIANDISDAAGLCFNWGICDCHPTFRPALNGKAADSQRFIVSTDSLTMPCSLDSIICEDEDCNESFVQWNALEVPAIDKESSSSLKNGSKPEISRRASGSDPCDAIAVDSDLEDFGNARNFSLRVFEIEAGADLESAITSLSQCTEISSPEEEKDLCLRRSSRRRKSHYPVGVVKEEETIPVGLHHNIAALRLFLLERCAKGSPFELNHKLKLVVTTPSPREEAETVDEEHGASDVKLASKGTRPEVMDLDFSVNEKTLTELCERSLGRKIDSAYRPHDNIMLLREAAGDSSAKDVSKETLMDFFIGLANTTTDDVATGKGAKGRSGKKTTEKGFSGTFLSSAPTAKADSDASKNTSKEASSGSANNTAEPLTKVAKDTCESKNKDDHLAEGGFSGSLLSNGPNAKAASGMSKVNGSEEIKKKSSEDNPTPSKRDANENTFSDVRSSNECQKKDRGSQENSHIEIMDVDDDDLSVNDKHNVVKSNVVAKPSAITKKSSRGTNLYASIHKRTKKSVLEMLESDEDDDVIFSGGLTPTGKKRNMNSPADAAGDPEPSNCAKEEVESSNQAQNGGKRRRLCLDEHGLAMRVTKHLLKNPNVDKNHESLCWDAAEWAVQSCETNVPDVDQIADMAYAKYFELCMGD